MVRKGRVVSAVLILTALAAGRALGAPSLETRISARRVTEGETIIIEFTVSGGNPGVADVSALSKNFIVRGPDRSVNRSVSWVNGRKTSVDETTLRYSLIARRTGALTIPSITIPVGEKRLTSQPISVTILKESSVGKVMMNTSFSRNTCYIGEQLVMTIEILSAVQPAKTDVDLAILRDPRFHAVTLADTPYSGTLIHGRKSVAGEDFFSQTARIIVMPRQTGTFNVGEGSVTCIIPVGWKTQRSFFGGLERVAEHKRKVAVAASSSLIVRPAPKKGQPADFSGIVGRPSLRVTASPKTASVGEPIDYVVEFSGLPYLRGIPPLELERHDVFTKNFKIQDDGLAGRMDGSVLKFRRTLRARSDSIKEIPELRISYLDPATGKYGRAVAPAIPVRIRPTKIISVGDGTGNMPAVSKIDIEALPGGIAGNEVGMDVISDSAFAVADIARSPGLLAVLIGPMLLYFAAGVSVRLAESRSADGASVKARRAFRAARAALRALGRCADGDRGLSDALARIIYEYTGARLRRPSAGLSPAEVSRLLEEEEVPDAVIKGMDDLLCDLEADRFGGFAHGGAKPGTSTGHPGEGKDVSSSHGLINRAEKLLKAVEKAL